MTTQPSIHTTSDVVNFLKQQHEQIKGLFAKVLGAHGAQRQQAFYELRGLIAIHETAEEEVVHPAARRARGVGEAVVSARLREEKEAKIALMALETMDVDAPAFEVQFRSLQSAVLAHAGTEESEEFDRLANDLDENQLVRMRKAVRFAQSLLPAAPAPGRPATVPAGSHAGGGGAIESAETYLPYLVERPFANLVDRARDALGRREADVRTNT